MIDRLLAWFGLDWFAETDRRLELLESWIRNIDAALWRIDQALKRSDPAAVATADVAQLKTIAEQIREDVQKVKMVFPTRMEDLRP